MVFQLFQQSQPLLLRPEGVLEPLEVLGRRLGGPIVVISRQLCVFEYFKAADLLKSGAALSAARIKASTSAPFQNAGYVITRHRNEFGIWWWDSERLIEQLAVAGLEVSTAVWPEPLLQPPGQDFRVIRSKSGFQSQLWGEDFLIADSWGRQPPNSEDWFDFARPWLEEGEEIPGIPLAQSIPLVWGSPYRRSVISNWAAVQLGQIAAALIIVMLLGASAYLFGESLSLRRQTAEMRAETTLLQEQVANRARAQREGASLALVRQEFDQTDPVILLKHAQEILLPFGYKISSFKADKDKVEITLPEEAVAGVELLATEFDASPYFTATTPLADRASKHLVLELTVRGQHGRAKPSASGTKSSS